MVLAEVRMRVAIVLCTFNGARFLREQLESIGAQSHSDWMIFASDDGSSDATIPILNEYSRRFPGRLMIFHGPRRGFASNFFSVLSRPEVRGDYFAFCDQDDVWERDKLTRAIGLLAKCEVMALYGSGSINIDCRGHEVGQSRAPEKLKLRDVLIHNPIRGNSMVINELARDFCCRHSKSLGAEFAHDWWILVILMAAGASIQIDPVPTVRYRQHGSNVLGSPGSASALIRRAKLLVGGQYGRWIRANLSSAKQVASSYGDGPDLTKLSDALSEGGWTAASAFLKVGVRRPSLMDTILVYLAILARRV